MNSAEDQSNSIADAAIDRLVDGSLDDAGRRALLTQLDGDPEGWRRCALAFLEDQAWRMALTEPPSPGLMVGPSPTSRVPRRSRLRLPIAASVLAATFAAGLGVGGAGRGRGPVEVARPGPAMASPTTEERPPDPVREVGWVDLVDRSSGESPPRRLPILSGPGLDERWLRDQPPSVPDYVRAQWERQGYQVEERRRLVSVVLEDGRRVSIPVDEVEVEYVGQEPL